MPGADGLISLREAIIAANNTDGEQTITFDKKVFETPQTITLDPTLGQLELSHFEAHEEHGLPELDRRVVADVQSQGRLAHCRTSRQNG